MEAEPIEPLLSVVDVYRILGISKPTLYRLMERGELESVAIGRRRMFEPDVLRQFIAARRR